MSDWSGITSNKIVTDTELNRAVVDGVFAPITTIPLSDTLLGRQV